MNTTDHSHLGQEVIQALLDGRLSGGERSATERHLADCGRCRGRVEEWKVLFARLDSLPELAPSEGFSEAVMAGLQVRAPLRARIRQWLGLGARRPTPTGHLESELVLEYLDGALPRHARERATAHLEVCAHCQAAVSRWRTLVEGLESLDRVSPSEGFGDRVMARIRTPGLSPAPSDAGAGVVDRALDWMRSVGPRTRRGWTVAAGTAGAPVAALGAAAYALFSHPQLTPESLAAFLWWQASGAVSTISISVAEAFVESSVIFQLWSALQGVAASPLTLGGGIAAFSAATVGAVWILYRNLIATQPVDRSYANASA